MSLDSIARLARFARKPPGVILDRMGEEVSRRAERFLAPRRASRFDDSALLSQTGSTSLPALWARLRSQPFPNPVQAVARADFEGVCPGDGARIFAAADLAIARRVDLLGTGPVFLGSPIDWHRDFKTGKTWPPRFMRNLNYMNLECPSDVKVPWEVSRLQWLIPAGLAYLLSNEERYAVCVRDVLDDWIAANPYAGSVNWACTMEPAMRVLSWTWFFHVFAGSEAWNDHGFRSRLLGSLFLHGEFTERYLERSEINGNHFTTDATALVVAGAFFGQGSSPERWSEQGWLMLEQELPRQVLPDGVDFEASVAYHRLVLELFFLAARARQASGQPVSHRYRDQVIDMARFTLAYSRRDGSTPLSGDADDARALPFGDQPMGDHRYLVGLVGANWQVPDLIAGFSGSRSEVFWTLGLDQAASLPDRRQAPAKITSAGFKHGGVYVMRNQSDHVFIDCGPVGLAGQGGHGHSDCLSFEAVLDGVHLITDCGAFVYTASAEERNRFRSTAYHNTPQIDGQEANRLIAWDHLWTLHNDALPEVRRWQTNAERDLFVGAHAGYHRLDDPVTPVRTIVLDHLHHRLTVSDCIEGSGHHAVTVPLHLAPGVEAHLDGADCIALKAAGRTFLLSWSGAADDWKAEIGQGRVSPSYGVVVSTVTLTWRRTGPLPSTLTMRLQPSDVPLRATTTPADGRNAARVQA